MKTPKTKVSKEVRAWAVYDLKESRLGFITNQKGSWYIAPSLKKRFIPIQGRFTYTLPKPKRK